MLDRSYLPNLTELERRAIDSVINLSDGHPRQDPTASQAKLIGRLPEFFETGAVEPFAEIENRAQAAFLEMLGQFRAPVAAGRVFSVYSSSVATMAVGNVLMDHRVAMIHPTFDNIQDILARTATLIPLSEEEFAEGELSRALAADATCVFITTPNNPTGWVLDEAALRRVAECCAANGLVICLDVSFRGFDPRAQFDHYAVLEDAGADYIVIEDTGKLWPMQELKLGFVAVSESMRAKVEHVLSDVLLTVSPFVLTLIEMLAVDAAHGEVHLAKTPGGVVRLLTVDGDVTLAASVFFDEGFRLNKHAARAAAGVVNTSLVRLQHGDQGAHNRPGRVELAAALAFRPGELRQEILIDPPQHIR